MWSHNESDPQLILTDRPFASFDHLELGLLGTAVVLGGSVNLLALVSLVARYRKKTFLIGELDEVACTLWIKLHLTWCNVIFCLVLCPWRFIWIYFQCWFFGDFMCRLVHYLLSVVTRAYICLLFVGVVASTKRSTHDQLHSTRSRCRSCWSTRLRKFQSLLESSHYEPEARSPTDELTLLNSSVFDVPHSLFGRVRRWSALGWAYALLSSLPHFTAHRALQPAPPKLYIQCVSVFQWQRFYHYDQSPVPFTFRQLQVYNHLSSFWLPAACILLIYGVFTVKRLIWKLSNRLRANRKHMPAINGNVLKDVRACKKRRYSYDFAVAEQFGDPCFPSGLIRWVSNSDPNISTCINSPNHSATTPTACLSMFRRPFVALHFTVACLFVLSAPYRVTDLRAVIDPSFNDAVGKNLMLLVVLIYLNVVVAPIMFAFTDF